MSAARTLTRLRKLCLALPEATEKEAWGSPTFRVRDKLFAHYLNDHHGDGRVALWCKAPVGDQDVLVESDPEVFFVPPYVGHKGWISMRCAQVPWKDIEPIVLDAYRQVALKRMLKTLDGE